MVLVDERNEAVGHNLTVLVPILAVLARTALKVSATAVREHSQEKDRVVVGND